MNEGQGVIVRASLYFAVASLTPIAGVLGESATDWPCGVRLAAAALSGLVAGLVAVRAYLDGSNTRYEARRGKP
jgi:hypothetical protein